MPDRGIAWGNISSLPKPPMGQTERLYKIKNQLDAGRCLRKAVLLQELGISPATLKRDLRHLRDSMNAPLTFDHELKGWRLDPRADDGRMPSAAGNTAGLANANADYRPAQYLGSRL